MSQHIIVSGIGTEVGKTVCSAILCEALNADYWKPVQAGDLNNSDSMKVESWISNTQSVVHPEAYKLNHPMSPHAAAKRDGVEIIPENLVVPKTENTLIIEMAGGLMVPLSDHLLYIDWIKTLNMPVVLVSSYYLGSINHTLLSWSILRQYGIPCLGIIFNGEKNIDSYEVISRQTKAKCLLQVEREEVISPEVISEYARRLTIN